MTDKRDKREIEPSELIDSLGIFALPVGLIMIFICLGYAIGKRIKGAVKLK